MLSFFKNMFTDPTPLNGWQPAERPYLINRAIASELYENGFVTATRLEPLALEQLQQLYRTLHTINRPEGCMFSSHHSADTEYRKKVQEGIKTALTPTLDNLFNNYKIAINTFLIKVSGPESCFDIHQDHTGVDEYRYSTTSVWVPLQDVTLQNGCLWLIPKSHHMFSPWRGTGIPEPYKNIVKDLLPYMQPIELKAGDVFLFDNRTVHCSLANNTGITRVAAISTIMPSEAKLVTCYGIQSTNQIQVVEHDESYTSTYSNFYLNKKAAPAESRLLKVIENPMPVVSKKQFATMCKKHRLNKISHPTILNSQFKEFDIASPVYGNN